MQSSRDHDVTRMVNRPPAPVKVLPGKARTQRQVRFRQSTPETPIPGLDPRFTFTSPSPETLKNDEEPAGHEEGKQNL